MVEKNLNITSISYSISQLQFTYKLTINVLVSEKITDENGILSINKAITI